MIEVSEEEFRREVQARIVAIILSGASEERMAEMLANVHRVEAWPVLELELALLGMDRGEG